MNLLNRLRPSPARANAGSETSEVADPADAAASASGADGGAATDSGAAAAPAGSLPSEGPVADLLETIDLLEDVLARETELLSQNDPQAMAEIQARKTQLAAAYETRVKGLTDDPGPLHDLDATARAALRERMTAFDRQMRANARAINAARAVTEDLLRSTVEIVKQHRRESGGYAAHGGRREESERLSAPLNIDRNL